MSTDDDERPRWSPFGRTPDPDPGPPPPPPVPSTTTVWTPGPLPERPPGPPPPPQGYPPAPPGYPPPRAYPPPPPAASPPAGWAVPIGWPPPVVVAPVPPRRGNARVVVATVVVWALVMVGIVVGIGEMVRPDRRQLAVVGDPSARVRVAEPAELPVPGFTGRTAPAPGFEEASGRLVAEAVPAVVDDSYALLDTQVVGGETVPVTWSPCRPVHVALNPAGAPRGFADDLLDALGVLSDATGLVFVYDGETSEQPDLERESYQPETYGDRWAPVLVAWSDDLRIPDFGDDVVGLAVSETRTDPRTGVDFRTSGAVFLDRDLLSYPPDLTGQAAHISVLHHELGHLVGLDHVEDPSQLMNAQDSGRLRGFQDGDLTGLAELGGEVCARGL